MRRTVTAYERFEYAYHLLVYCLPAAFERSERPTSPTRYEDDMQCKQVYHTAV